MKKCENCHNTDLTLKYVGNNYDVYKCKRCNHVQVFKGER